MKNRSTLLLAVSLVCGAAGADDYYDQMNRLRALDERCEQARAEKLAPIRGRLIQDCLKEIKHTPDPLQDCQSAYARYGESTTGPNMNLIKGLYYDLPECVEAAQAWNTWEESQPRRVR